MPICQMSVDLGQHSSQQCQQSPANALTGLNNFFLCDLFAGDSGRHIRDAGNRQHLKAHVSRDDDLGNRGHADQISADRAQESDLGGRLKVRTGHSRIDTLADVFAEPRWIPPWRIGATVRCRHLSCQDDALRGDRRSVRSADSVRED